MQNLLWIQQLHFWFVYLGGLNILNICLRYLYTNSSRFTENEKRLRYKRVCIEKLCHTAAKQQKSKRQSLQQ